MTISSEDIKTIEKFIQIRNKGLYCSGSEVTDVYNRVLNKRLAPTNCSSCVRQRISELETALNRFKKELEVNNTQEEKEENTEQITPKKTRKKNANKESS